MIMHLVTCTNVPIALCKITEALPDDMNGQLMGPTAFGRNKATVDGHESHTSTFHILRAVRSSHGSRLVNTAQPLKVVPSFTALPPTHICKNGNPTPLQSRTIWCLSSARSDLLSLLSSLVAQCSGQILEKKGLQQVVRTPQPSS